MSPRPSRLPARPALSVPRPLMLAAVALLAACALLGAPALADAAPARTLRLGSTGPDVAALNVRLAALGYLPAGTAGATYTEATRHAVVAAQKWHGLGRDGVAGPRTLAALSSATRPVPRRPGGAGARIEVLLDRQLALLIRDGRVHRTIAVSTGAPGYATPPGSFRVSRKETRSWSYPYQVWLPYASYFNRGIALHGHVSVPPYAASHGCVRVPEAFMREVYAFAAKGTGVRVL